MYSVIIGIVRVVIAFKPVKRRGNCPVISVSFPKWNVCKSRDSLPSVPDVICSSRQVRTVTVQLGKLSPEIIRGQSGNLFLAPGTDVLLTSSLEHCGDVFRRKRF